MSKCLVVLCIVYVLVSSVLPFCCSRCGHTLVLGVLRAAGGGERSGGHLPPHPQLQPQPAPHGAHQVLHQHPAQLGQGQTSVESVCVCVLKMFCFVLCWVSLCAFILPF